MKRTVVVVTVSACAALGLPSPAGARPVAGPDGKLDSHLRTLAAGQQAHRDVVTDADRQGIDVSGGGRVLVDVYVRGPVRAAAGELQLAGMEVKAATDRAPVPMVEGWVPLGDLDALARLSVTRAVLPVTGGGTDAAGGADAGSVQSQGDASHRGPQARALGGGVTGAGVKVGVISDSINRVGTGVAGSQATGDLPPAPGVTVLSDGAAAGSTDEGRAMAEIIYDEAPGATISFASGTATGSVGKANAIRALKADGAPIIADDIFYLTEPFFQDGAVAQAVDEVAAGGVSYFASAGNRARQSYEGTFVPGVGGLHDFGGGDTRQHVVDLSAGAFFQLTLQWDEPFGAATTDLDALLYNGAGTQLAVGQGETDNLTTRLPIETVTYTNTTGATVPINLDIKRIAGTRTPLMKYIARGNFGSFTIAEHNTASNSINPDAAAARGSLAVAAVKFDDPGLSHAESFSSRGVLTRLFDKAGHRLATPDVRQKPELAAADGVSTDLPPGGLNPFFGTSAATPSAAGVAALVKSAKPSITVAQLNSIMTNPGNTVDCALAGLPDPDCGFGFILADRAVGEALDATPPVVVSTLTPPAPNGTNGWYTVPVTVALQASDAESRVFSRSAGCATTPVVADGVATITCTATSAGGTTALPVTIKKDSVAPSTPSFSGIVSGRRYSSSGAPSTRAVRCAATDATSGVASCVVTGYSRRTGRHTATATARDQAGLTSTRTLTYTVLSPPRAGIVSRSIKIDRLGRGTAVVSCAGGSTCRGSLKLRIRSKRRTLVLAGARFAIGAGHRGKVRVRLSKTGRSRLSARRRLAVELLVTGANTTRRQVTLRR